LIIANSILGGGSLKSRLADRIRQKDGISYGVGSALNISHTDQAGRWNTTATCNPGNIGKLQQAFREEVGRALKDGFTEQEIADAKESWRQRGAVFRTQDEGVAYMLAESMSYGRTLAYDADMEKKIMALSNDQILQAIRKYVLLDNLVIIKAGDFKTYIPHRADMISR